MIFCAAGVLAPGTLLAGENSEKFSLFASLVQMFGALAVVLGVILLIYYAASRWLRIFPPAGSSHRYIRVIETRYIAQKQSLVLVEVGGNYLLISSSPAGIQLLTQVDMLEEIDVVEESFGGLRFSGTENTFSELFARFVSKRKAGEKQS